MTRGCVIWLSLCLGLLAQAAEEKPARQGGSRQPVQTTKCSDVPEHPFDLILGRPTATSVTVSVLCHADAEGFIAYGTRPDQLSSQTPARRFHQGEPVEIVLSALQTDTRFFYQLRLTRTNSALLAFHTARPPGSPFTFTITADSHLDDHTEPAIYQQTLANARADNPDFHIDLGDTFMTEKHATREDATRQYLAQRYYFGALCQGAPLFLALGNHDGESLQGHGKDPAALAVWSNLTRKRYFPNPVPDGFYAGNDTPHPQAGVLQDYYAWTWGDALFIVLDPFWFTPSQRGNKDAWTRTLGIAQYQWLKRTLETSHAKLKFVFIHHLVGGAGGQSRGGAEAAPFYEWGGRNADGSDGFAPNRPCWPAPIHELLARNKVNIVFHGHDHFYAKQELDGIIYQEVPQPGAPGSVKPPRSAAEYGYRDGIILGSSGHLRVTVADADAKVEYIRSDPPNPDGGDHPHRLVADTYRVCPPGTR